MNKKMNKKILMLKKEITISILFFKNLILEINNNVDLLINNIIDNLKIFFSLSFFKNLFLIINENKNEIKEYVFFSIIMLFMIIIKSLLFVKNYYKLFKNKKKNIIKNIKITYLFINNFTFILIENLYVLFSFFINYFLFFLNKFIIFIYFLFIKTFFCIKLIKISILNIIENFFIVLLEIFNKNLINFKKKLLYFEIKFCCFLSNLI